MISYNDLIGLRKSVGRSLKNVKEKIMQSQDKQFLKYTPVSGEKHLGIAAVRWLGKIILRFKVLPSQNGGGYWLAAGSTKIGLRNDGKDNYEPWFDLDSNYEKDDMKEFILWHVENEMRRASGQQYSSNPSANPHQSAQSPQGQGMMYNQPASQGQSYFTPNAPMQGQVPSQQTLDDGLPF